MKTQVTMPAIARFLKETKQVGPETVRPLVEGHSSQAYSFEYGTDKYVLRLAETDANFKADRFAHEHFGGSLPIPEVLEIGGFNEEVSYCITRFVEGKTSNTLSDEEISRALPSIQKTLAATFTADISFGTGYGDLNVASGSAPCLSWREHLAAIGGKGTGPFKSHAVSIELPADLIDMFFKQYEANLPFASETRRLLHGDPAFDNMLVSGDKVVAVLDWAQLGYGDWMSDFARLDFWWPGRYGDKAEFAKNYDLEADHLDERQALYWATNALWTIEFANKAKSETTVQWLREHIRDKLVL